MERIEVTESGDRDLDKNAENPGQGWENLSRETEEPNWGIVDGMEAQLEGEEVEREKSEYEKFSEEIANTHVVVYEQLNASNDKEAKAEFLENDELTRPNNFYGNLDVAKDLENLKELDRIKEEINETSMSEKEKRALEVFWDDNKRKNDFLISNYVYNTAKTPEEKEEAKKWHEEVNEALYGKPDEGTFYAILREKLESISPETEEEKAEQKALIEKIGDLPEAGVGRFKPKGETVARFSEVINEFFGGFLAHIPEEKEEFSSEEIVAIINEILEEEFDGGTEYTAVIDSGKANASVNNDERKIKFPEGKTYSKDRAKALICHELGTHVMRAIPYEGHPNVAFSRELPGNVEFDEGVAKCVEQAIKGKYEDSGIYHYINIGMANFKGKNFREVYEISKSLNKLDKKDTRSEDKVLTDVQRCFRGTGELPNNKDLAYYNGANQVWKYIEENIDDPELLMDHLFLSGKTIATDKSQERLVYETKVGGL